MHACVLNLSIFLTSSLIMEKKKTDNIFFSYIFQILEVFRIGFIVYKLTSNSKSNLFLVTSTYNWEYILLILLF